MSASAVYDLLISLRLLLLCTVNLRKVFGSLGTCWQPPGIFNRRKTLQVTASRHHLRRCVNIQQAAQVLNVVSGSGVCNQASQF